MITRPLGALEVSAIGFGAMVLSPGLYGPTDDARSAAALHHALDGGVTLIDTSDSYGPESHNEQLIGRTLRARRDAIVLATKFGFRPPAGVERHAFPVGYRYGQLAVNAEPQHVRACVEESLRRLQTDHVDLLYPHFPDPSVPIEDTVGAMADLVDAGLVRHLGLSNVTAEHLRASLAVHPIAAVQVEWSLWQASDPALLELTTANDVGIVAWSPLGGGFLTGSVAHLAEGDFRHNQPRFETGNLQTNNDRYQPIRTLASELGLTPGQLALAWLLHQSPTVVPIPGSGSPDHIDENLAAASIVLDAGALACLEDAVAAFRPVGATLFGDRATSS